MAFNKVVHRVRLEPMCMGYYNLGECHHPHVCTTVRIISHCVHTTQSETIEYPSVPVFINTIELWLGQIDGKSEFGLYGVTLLKAKF